MKTIRIDELCEISGISRKTMDTVLKDLHLEDKKEYLGNKKVAYINTKYLPSFILYVYCTKNIGKVENNNLDITLRTGFSVIVKEKPYIEAIKIIEEQVTKNFFLLKEIKSVIESNNIDLQLNILRKLDDYSKGIYEDKSIVVDTSSLHKRPAILDDLITKFKRVIIPNTVIRELENQKDSKYSSKDLKRRSSLILSTIANARNRLVLSDNSYIGIKNDDKILEVALNEKKPETYILSEDKGFKIRCHNTEIEAISLKEYDLLFHNNTSDYDIHKTMDFIKKVENSDIEGIKLLDLSNIDMNHYSSEGFTPLIKSIRLANRNKDNIMIVKFLAKQKKVDLNKIDSHKYKLTPLAHAVQMKRPDIIRYLISKGADVNLGGEGVNYNNTPLMIASWNGDIRSVKELLKDNDICINQVDSNGFTPLIKASIRNKVNVAKVLLEHGADTKIRSFGKKTALDYAIVNANLYKNKKNKTKEYNDALDIIRMLSI